MPPRPRRSRIESLLPGDPLPWIESSIEPAARFIFLTELKGMPDSDPCVRAVRKECLADPSIKSLADRLPEWENETPASGHHSPAYTPNLLGLLADLGLGPKDHPNIERSLDRMLVHQDESGRFQALGRFRAMPRAAWGALFCDSHIILDILVRFGRESDSRAAEGLSRMAADISETANGPGWLCRPDPIIKFRGPGRKDDFCPMVTLEALRCFARLPERQRPDGLLAAARTCLRAWRMRDKEKPYMFGHGRQFKIMKWPPFWYGAYRVLDALSRYPRLWQGREAREEDRSALAEMAACLIAYNFNAEGRVVPRSCCLGFEGFSFGQKKTASPLATAMACIPLARLFDLADEIASVDVAKLKSSKGGTGKPRLP
ncbi:MAG: hypothetical protein JW843_02380 [Candidatus Aminicenantes bacterium]|nr:hypothetical protein [Candidatus Aminicenantes bacterium]